MIIKNLKTAAKAVGINAFITNSTEGIETQLNRLTRQEDLPIMLVSWDLAGDVDFDSNGFIKNPDIAVTCLLLSKPEDKSKDVAEDVAELMSSLFLSFLQTLATIQRPLLRTTEFPISKATFQMVPKHGISGHAGALGKFSVKGALNVPCVKNS